MLKILLLVAVVVIAILLFKSRHRVPGAPPPPRPPGPPTGPQAMLACAHCGVHLPQNDALMDAAGRPFCTEAHRLAGPR